MCMQSKFYGKYLHLWKQENANIQETSKLESKYFGSTGHLNPLCHREGYNMQEPWSINRQTHRVDFGEH